MIHIIGIGMEGVSSISGSSMDIIRKAKLIIGSERHLKQLTDIPETRKYSLKSDLFKIVDVIQKKKKSDVVVLASGDPNLFGITGYLLKHFEKEDLTIAPAVSSMQWAFALAKETWEDAEIVSAHGRGMDDVVRAAFARDKVGVFTDDKNSPDKIANALLGAGVGERRLIVCENIGTDDVKVIDGSLEEISQKKFAPMNVMIIKKERSVEAGARQYPKTIGIPDFQFFHRDGMITKAEIRAISISKMRPEKGCVMWDVGAGSGSVAIESEPLIAPGKVYAVEKDLTQIAFIKKNIARFQTNCVEPVWGEAPEALKFLPDPDLVFVGGSGGQISEILDYIDSKIKKSGRIVVNVVTLENLADTISFMNKKGYAFDITSVNIARSKELTKKHFLVAANPVHVVLGIKM